MRLTLIFIIVTLFVACGDEVRIPEIEITATPILESNEQWAVVMSPYIPLRSENNLLGKTLKALRQYDVLKVNGISKELATVEGEDDYWYRVSINSVEGWVHGSYLQFYQTKAQAIDATGK